MVCDTNANKKKKYRITNWPEYTNALKNRGSLTVWIEDGFEKTWYEEARVHNKRGRPLPPDKKLTKREDIS